MQKERNTETNLPLSFMATFCVGCLWGLCLCFAGVSPTIVTSRSFPFEATSYRWGCCLSEALLGVFCVGVDSTICTSRSFPFEATAHLGLEHHCGVLTGGSTGAFLGVGINVGWTEGVGVVG